MSSIQYISSSVLSSSASEISFVSIPSNFNDIVLNFTGSLDTTGQIWVYVNNDYALTNYSQTRMDGTGSANISTRLSSKATWEITSVGETAPNNICTFTLTINSYSSSLVCKTGMWLYSDPSSRMTSSVGLWRSTSPITQIAINTFNTQKFNIGSTATLWGIA